MAFSYVPREAGDGMMHITRPQAQALAAFISRIRDDWDHRGIVAAITKAGPLGTAADVGTALCRLAANRDLRTPAMLADPGPHWRDTTVASRTPPVMCVDHPSEPARECRQCRALSERADHEQGAAAVKAALARRTRPALAVRREPAPRDLKATRARADQETAS